MKAYNNTARRDTSREVHGPTARLTLHYRSDGSYYYVLAHSPKKIIGGHTSRPDDSDWFSQAKKRTLNQARHKSLQYKIH